MGIFKRNQNWKRKITGCWVESGPSSKPPWSGGLLRWPGQKTIAAHPMAGFGLDGPDWPLRSGWATMGCGPHRWCHVVVSGGGWRQGVDLHAPWAPLDLLLAQSQWRRSLEALGEAGVVVGDSRRRRCGHRNEDTRGQRSSRILIARVGQWVGQGAHWRWPNRRRGLKTPLCTDGGEKIQIRWAGVTPQNSKFWNVTKIY
jgi:hypothetical protein